MSDPLLENNRIIKIEQVYMNWNGIEMVMPQCQYCSTRDDTTFTRCHIDAMYLMYQMCARTKRKFTTYLCEEHGKRYKLSMLLDTLDNIVAEIYRKGTGVHKMGELYDERKAIRKEIVELLGG